MSSSTFSDALVAQILELSEAGKSDKEIAVVLEFEAVASSRDHRSRSHQTSSRDRVHRERFRNSY